MTDVPLGNGHPVPFVALGAHQFAGQMGNRRRTDYRNVKVDPGLQREAADSYLALPSHDEAALPSFRAMREETGRQFDFLTKPQAKGGLGVTVGVTREDPYVTKTGAPNSMAMMRDLHQNRNINVLSTGSTGGHPFFSNDENDQFRAVHDAFGHAGTGRNFTADGEESAWLSHSAMYSPLARQAMTVETRGQNSVNNAYPDRAFGEQKIGLLHPRFALPSTSNVNRGALLRAAAFGSK